MELQRFGGRGGGSGMSGGGRGGSVGESLTNVHLEDMEFDVNTQSMVETGEQSINVNLSNQADIETEALGYLKWLDKGTARWYADEILNGPDSSHDVGGYLIRNTVQRVANNQLNRDERMYIKYAAIDKSLSKPQQEHIYKSIQKAARTYIENDKSTKAGTKYWKKKGR